MPQGEKFHKDVIAQCLNHHHHLVITLQHTKISRNLSTFQPCEHAISTLLYYERFVSFWNDLSASEFVWSTSLKVDIHLVKK